MSDPYLDPLVVVDQGLCFEHEAGDIAAARDFIGPVKAHDDWNLARLILTRVHERMRVLPTAFGLGMPRTLASIMTAGGGNCVSHAVLATVLLRDRGFPTRLISENVYTNISLLRAPGSFVRAPIGPVLNGHAWIEVFLHDEWIPADAELGIIGRAEWLAARLASGTTLAALGIPIREHWKFPLRIRCLGPDGAPTENLTSLYLIDSPASALGPSVTLPSAWTEGVRHFSRSFRWGGWAGVRILREHRRLREMSRSLGTFAGDLLLTPGAQPPAH